MNEILSESDVYQRGKINNVVLTLDDGDHHYPSGHWANTRGTRMYSLSRVQIAEDLVTSFKEGVYYHNNADEINKMRRPVSEPYIIFNYRIIAKHILHLFPESSLRPYIPSFPGFETVKKKRPFIVMDFINIANYAFPENEISNEKDLLKLLDEIMESSLSLYSKPWPIAIAREQVLKSNIYTGKSRNAALKILKIVSLIRSKHISIDLLLYRDLHDIFEVLGFYSVLRIDHKIHKLI